jgi:hypothetical protein
MLSNGIAVPNPARIWYQRGIDMPIHRISSQKVLQFQSRGTLLAILFAMELSPPGLKRLKNGTLGVVGVVLSREFVLLLRLTRSVSQLR